MYKLKDWVDINNIQWLSLSRNQHAIFLLEQNIDKIDWDQLSRNHCAIHILKKHIVRKMQQRKKKART